MKILLTSQAPRQVLLASLITVSMLTGTAVAEDDPALSLDPVIVTADFRQNTELETLASITVLGEATLESAGTQHFEEVLSLVPNLNWSGGTSRPRYLQIRGIGERSQYQGAPNPSVGFILDDVDFSGIGMVATLFDLEQAEVLRGPQGTRYGANALAGLVNLRSQAPTDVLTGRFVMGAGGDDARSAGFVLSGPIGESSARPAFRLSAQRYRADGFRDNAFLSRDDTNQRDETTARFKLRWQAGQGLMANLTVFAFDIDNGYDAFAIDNSLTTLSDKPGKDAQLSRAAALRLDWTAHRQYSVQSISSIADSDIEFSFDGDWGNDPGWSPYDPYDFYSRTDRQRKTVSQEFRFVSEPGYEIFGGRSAWLAGIYAQRLEERNANRDFFNGDLVTTLDSDYSATNAAVFGQLDTQIGEVTTLTTGLRLEHRESDYSDTDGSEFSPAETMLGGQVALSRKIGDRLHAYTSMSRGFKAGGFNIGARIPEERRLFEAEFLWNLEAGIKGWWPEHGLRASLSAFFMLRRDQQVSTSFQDDPSDPLSYTFFNDNAASGRNLGIEAEWSWSVNRHWRLFGALGLLKTRFDEYLTPTRTLNGRAQAHAPSYSFSLGGEYRSAHGLYSRVDVSGRDAFYYSDSHDQKSRAYELVNLRLGWVGRQWDVYAWGRNIFNRKYTVRGFYFGNEPPDYPEKLYTRQGDPRVVGASVDFRF